MLHNSVIGQNLNLTSCSFRAFRFAKRCPGGRGAVPLLGWSLRRFPPIPRGRWRGRFAARRLAWVVDRAFRRGRRGWGAAIANQISCRNLGRWLWRSASPVPKAPLCKGSCHGFAVTEGLSGVDGPFWVDLCSDFSSFLPSAAQTLRCAPPAWVVAETSPSLRRGRCLHRPAARHHLCCTRRAG